jgi:branched-chain amino acid transport system permease protein
VDLFIQQCVNGLSLGAVYALFAMGFGLFFSTTSVLNFAHGMFATFACIAAYATMSATSLPFVVAAAVALIVVAAMAVAVDAVAFAPMRRRNAGLLGPLMTSVGVWIALLAVAEMTIGQDARPLSAAGFESWRFTLGGVSIRWLDVVSVIVCVAVAVSLHVLLRRSRLGLAIRAVGWSERSALVAGVSSRTILALIAVLSAVIAAIAGLLDGLLTGSISPQLGDELLIVGFAVTVVGGVGDVRGSVIAGFAIGLIEVLSVQYLGAQFRNAVTFGLLLVFLVLRPSGIFGRVEKVRA